MWLGDGLATPNATWLLPVMMYTPAAAVLIVMLLLKPVQKGERLRFLGIWPLRPAKRVVWLSVLAVLGTIATIVAAMFIALAFGWFTADFAGLSGFREIVEAATPEGTPIPATGILVAIQLLSVPIAAVTVNAVAAFGEEVGWRGFLVPALRRFGTWPALLASGAIWGLWHSPIILLGYNFERPDLVGVLLMTACCIAWGVLLGWLRLRSGSVWPAVFAHGAMNAAMGLPALFIAAGAPLDPALGLGIGVSGWIACAIVILALVLAGQFRTQPALATAAPTQAPPAVA